MGARHSHNSETILTIQYKESLCINFWVPGTHTITANNDTAAPAYGTNSGTWTDTNVTLTKGTQVVSTTPAATPAAFNATAGDKVALTTTTTDAGGNKIATVQYRVQRPNGVVTDWVNLEATDGAFDEITEAVKAEIDTTGWAPGSHNIEIRTVDAFSNASATTTSAFSATPNARILIAGSDITAPVCSGARHSHNSETILTIQYKEPLCMATAVWGFSFALQPPLMFRAVTIQICKYIRFLD